jgi:Protein of unknown function (DUF2917)
MDTTPLFALEQLTKDALLKLQDVQGSGVAAFSGCLWITQDGDLRDIIVEAGESFRFDRPGRVLIQALSDSQLLRLEPIAPPPPMAMPSAQALHRAARRQRSEGIGRLLQHLVAALRRTWSHA